LGIFDKIKQYITVTDDVKEIRDRIRRSPNDPALHQKLAERLAKKGEYSDAIAEYYTAASLFEKGGFGSRAVAVLRQCLKIDPTNLETVKKVMEGLVENGLTGDAIFEFQKVMTNNDFFPNPQSREEFVNYSLKKLGEIPEIHIFIIRDYMKNRNRIGIVSSIEKTVPQIKTNKQLSTFVTFIEGIVRDLDDPEYIEEVFALSLLSSGFREKGMAMLDKIEGTDPGEETREIIGIVREYFSSVESDSSFPRTFSSVKQYLEEREERSLEEKETAEVEAEEEGKTEKKEDLEAVLDKLREKVEEEIGEEDLNARYNLGIAFKEMGLFEDALREFSVSKGEESLYFSSTLMLKECYEGLGRYEEAMGLLDELVEHEGLEEKVRLDIMYQKGLILEKQGDLEKARVQFGKVYEIDENFRDVSERVSQN